MKDIIHKIKNDRVTNKINHKLGLLTSSCHVNSSWWTDYSKDKKCMFSVTTIVNEIYLYREILVLFDGDDINIVKECIITKFNYSGFTFDNEII